VNSRQERKTKTRKARKSTTNNNNRQATHTATTNQNHEPTMKFNVVPSFLRDSVWLKDVLDVLELILVDESFFTMLFVPVVQKFVEAAGSDCPSVGEIIVFGKGLSNSLEICIFIGNCESGVLARAVPKQSTIFINSNWFVQCERVQQEYRDEIEHSTESSVYTMVFSLVKFLHAIFHLLTPEILSFESQIRKTVDGKATIYTSTPIELGTKLLQEYPYYCGDMGYLMEEILFGQGLRIYHKSVHSGYCNVGQQCYFEQVTYEEVTTQDNITSSFKKRKSSDEISVKMEFFTVKWNFFSRVVVAMCPDDDKTFSCADLLRAFQIFPHEVEDIESIKKQGFKDVLPTFPAQTRKNYCSAEFTDYFKENIPVPRKSVKNELFITLNGRPAKP
jgi:hypothetical protein